MIGLKFLKEIFLTLLGAIPTIILPVVIFAYTTHYIEVNYTFKSVQFYAWLGFMWLIHLNYKK